jgi:hypothetical protein
MNPALFIQTEPTPWPSGHGEAAAVVARSPDELASRYALRFFEGSDNLDAYEAAAIRLASGRRLGLLRHRGSPSPGTELSSDTKFYAVGGHEDLRSHLVRNSRFFRGQRARRSRARCPLKKSLKFP